MPAAPTGAMTTALDNVPVAVTCLDPDGRILFVNEAAARNLAVSREEAIGTSVYEYFPARAAATRERIRQTIRHRTIQRFEAIVELPDGRLCRFDSAYCPAVGASGEVESVQIVAQELTLPPREKPTGRDDGPLWGVVTDDLSLTASRMRALLENAPMVVTVHDPDTTIRYVNVAPPGYEISDILGRSSSDLVPPEYRERVEAAFARTCKEKVVTECEVVGATGRSWLLRLAPLVHEGQVVQLLGCTLDITEQRRLQAQLAHKRRLASLGTMASGIAHDFNNLLTSIMGNASLARLHLADGADPTAQLDEILTAAQRAAELCDQMLTYAGHERLRPEAGNLDAAITEISSLARAAIGSKIRLEYELADGLPEVACSGAQLTQIVLNLIKNAADAIGDDAGEVRVTTRLVELSAPSEHLPEPLPPGRYVGLFVGDTGPGVDPAARDRIFDPFYSTKPSGRGLGLSVVMGIVSSIGAAIGVRSEAGRGTIVEVLLRIYDGPTRATEAHTRGTIAANGAGTILVVDDEDAVRRVATTSLARAGYEILQARDGDEALSLLAQAPGIDAIVLDATMPGRDGYDTLAELRKSHPRLPVVLSSGQPAAPGSLDHPCVWFLPKPYLPAALTQMVAESIRLARGGS